MLMRIFVALIIVVAIAAGILSLVLNHDQLLKLIIFREFFEAALPILALGALIKYLCSCCIKCKDCHDGKCE
jgi:hypothetical protein